MSDDSEIKINHLEGEKISHFKSLSGLEYKRIYDQKDWSGTLPDAGEYPFIRGVHKDMYRGRLWTRRQQSGFGSPEESNELIKYLLRIGQTGINMDADVGTKLGLDPDYPLAQGDVGLQGTSLCTYEDMKALFKDIPLDKVSSTLIIQPPCSAIIMAQYLLMAKEQGIPWEKLIGTIMNCAFTQLVGPTFQANTAFFPIDLQVKIALDVMEFLLPRVPRWNIINVNSRNIRETGVDAVQEVAFVLSLACDYIQGLLDRGLADRCLCSSDGLFLGGPHRFIRGSGEIQGDASDMGPNPEGKVWGKEPEEHVVPGGSPDLGPASVGPGADE